MAIYHVHAQIIGKSKGKSSVASACYRASEKALNERDGVLHDFTKKEKPLFKEILADKNAPSWVKDRAKFWNAVEERENKSNAVFCKEFNVALPKELTLEQNIEIAKKWVNENFTKNGLVADLCIHPAHKEKDGTTNENIHFHVMVCQRQFDNGEWKKNKFRYTDLGFKKESDLLKNQRESWATICNEKFKVLGIDEQIDHRTLEAQGIDRKPQERLSRIEFEKQKKIKNIPVEISEEELKTELEKDTEYLRLVELKNEIIIDRHYEKMDVETFKKEKINTEKALLHLEQKAEIQSTNEHRKEIKKTCFEVVEDCKKNIADLGEKPFLEEKKFWTRTYVDSNGYGYSDYEDYLKKQNGIINNWKSEKTKNSNIWKNAKLIHDEEKTAIDDKSTWRFWQTVKNNMPIIAEKIIDRAKEILDKSKDYKLFKQHKKAIEKREIRDRAEERKHYQEQNKNKSHSIGR